MKRALIKAALVVVPCAIIALLLAIRHAGHPAIKTHAAEQNSGDGVALSNPPSASELPASTIAEMSSEDRLQPLKQNPGSTPPWEALAKLKTSDEDVVISLFLSQTNFVNRRAAMAAMAVIGGVKSTDVLWATLTNNYQGSNLFAQRANAESDQERVLFNTAAILGFIAQRDKKAYVAVRQGTDPWYWKRTLTWGSDRKGESVGILTSSFIGAVGLSGQPEVGQFLEELKQQDLVNRTDPTEKNGRNFAGAIAQAAFHQGLLKKRGGTGLMEDYFSGRMHDQWLIWAETADGKAWWAWYNEARKQK